MKKNAILVAGILFLAGCATHQGGYASYEQGSSDMNGSYSTESGMNGATAPDSQFASSGGYARTDHIHADSSIRGGSAEARGYNMSSNPEEPNRDMQRDFRADGTLRDGSMGSASWSAEASDSNLSVNEMPESDLAQGGFDAVVVGEGSSKDNPELNGLPVAGTGETAPGPDLNSSKNLNSNIAGDIDAAASEPPRQYNNAEVKPSNSEERNTGRQQSDDAALLSGAVTGQSENNSALGAPASVSQGSASSSGSASLATAPESEVPVNGNQPNELFKNNRAQGIGSAATGETGAFSSANNSDPLAQSVKRELTKESTGTHGMLRAEIAKNIRVTASGDGVVTLSGTVPSEQDKQIVGIRAAEVKGVNRVDNQLKVAPQSDPANRDLSQGHDLEEQTDLNPQP